MEAKTQPIVDGPATGEASQPGEPVQKTATQLKKEAKKLEKLEKFQVSWYFPIVLLIKNGKRVH